MPLHLFNAYGIELEYMTVDAQTLSVRPIADRILLDEQGQISSEIEQGEIAWSNELTHHVIELKTNGPAAQLAPLAGQFQENVVRINERLKAENARLLPTAMHPWMDPQREMQLWPHEYHLVYETFDKIFDCRGHGWANLQSMHINLPFAGDEEFGKLHAAVRLLLPLLPALAASSPFLDGRPGGHMDSRLDVYRRNAKGVASVAGRVIPEPVFDEASYNREIFEPMFRDIAAYDPDGVLRNEFLNSRGAIARFSRGAIEIRVIDLQECPAADLAIATLVIEVLKLLVNETWTSTAEQQSFAIDALEPAFLSAITHGGEGQLRDERVLRQFGMPHGEWSLRDVWSRLYEEASRSCPELKTAHGPAIRTILEEGCLAKRILAATKGRSDRETLRDVYRQLADCLAAGASFHAS